MGIPLPLTLKKKQKKSSCIYMLCLEMSGNLPSEDYSDSEVSSEGEDNLAGPITTAVPSADQDAAAPKIIHRQALVKDPGPTTTAVSSADQDATAPKIIHRLALVLSVIAVSVVVVLLIVLILFLIEVYSFDTSEDISGAMEVLSYQYKKALSDVTDAFNKHMLLAGSLFNSSSCANILHRNPSASSGYYLVRSSKGHLTSVYCDMTRTCGDITGGWMRVAKLDLDNCPTGLKSQIVSGSERSCVAEDDEPGCTPVLYSSFDISYSRVCGMIRSYRIGRLDGFRGGGSQGNLDSNYLDGISVTSGSSHIMSLAAINCVCRHVPRFVDNFICDHVHCDARHFVCSDRLLWDGNGNRCGQPSPIFYKALSEPTSADIKLRLCRDEHRLNEDIALAVIELYVQ